MRSQLRRMAEQALQFAPARNRTGRTLILAYHNVLPRVTRALGDPSLHLDLERFAAHLEILKREADVVHLEEVLTATSSAKPRVTITFDDAYHGAILHGVSACTSAGLPCTVFVAPGLLGKVPAWDVMASQGNWSAGERESYLWTNSGSGGHLDPDEARNIGTDLGTLMIADLDAIRGVCQSPLVRIGNHTMHHVNLGAFQTETVVEEIVSAQQWLGREFGESSLNWLAYPYGIPPQETAGLLGQCGLAGAVLVNGGWTDPQQIVKAHMPRWNVPAGISDQGFLIRLRGWFAG